MACLELDRSEPWANGPNTTIFVGRSADRFIYVYAPNAVCRALGIDFHAADPKAAFDTIEQVAHAQVADISGRELFLDPPVGSLS
jgi:hypothetical protein